MKPHHGLILGLVVVGIIVFVAVPFGKGIGGKQPTTLLADLRSGKLHLGPLHWPTANTTASSGLVNLGSEAPSPNAS